jgi:CBS domain-containing protein
MRVKDIMTRAVVSITPKASVAEALDVMARSRLSGLPVIDTSGALIGIVTETDFIHRWRVGAKDGWLHSLLKPGPAAEAFVRTHGRFVHEVMTENVITVDHEDDLETAVALMEARRVQKLPVTDAGKVVGIVTRGDFVRTLAQFVRQSQDEEVASDSQIAGDVMSELRRRHWSSAASISVRVKDGVVVLSGGVADERRRGALRAIAENVSGVRIVLDNMDVRGALARFMDRVGVGARMGAR